MKSFFYFFFVLMVFALVFVSCDNEPKIPIQRQLEPGQIELIVIPSKASSVNLFFYVEEITIDWGDGTVEDIAPKGFSIHQHQFSDSDEPQIILISTKGLTEFSQFGATEVRFGYAPDLRTVATWVDFSYPPVGQNLRRLDVTKLNALENLSVFGTQLTHLDVSKNTALTRLTVNSTQLTSLDLSNNTALLYVNAQRNQLTNLDVTNNIALQHLIVSGNRLTNIDLNNNINLRTLCLHSNQLTGLDVSKNADLRILSLHGNQLTSLDVSRNIELEVLRTGLNQLTSLDVSNNTELFEVGVWRNQLTASALNSLFESLPTIYHGQIDVANNPGTNDSDRSIAENKGWQVFWR